mgnify:CR=1 FL=1
MNKERLIEIVISTKKCINKIKICYTAYNGGDLL